MGDFGVAATLRAEQKADVHSSQQKQGTLKAGGEEHTVYPIPDSEAVSKGVFEYVESSNQQKPELLLAEHEFYPITKETIETEHEIAQLSQDLAKTENQQKSEQKPQPTSPQLPTEGRAQTDGGRNPEVYSSLFSLARSFNQGLRKTEAAKKNETEAKQTRTDSKREVHERINFSLSPDEGVKEPISSKPRYDQEKDRDQGSGQQHQREKEEQQKKNKREAPVPKVNAKRGTSRASTPRSRTSSHSPSNRGGGPVGSMENIFIRFMALMARILGQAEAEAHDLYQRIKARTDNVDTLTLLISKINSSKGDIDWSKDEEMKKLVDRAREIGVDIPEGKYSWKEADKNLLKENIQMRKDSMEKMTQLERTDMQRYLQEASQCHQARSNVLKLLKEVMDTIIHNMRP